MMVSPTNGQQQQDPSFDAVARLNEMPELASSAVIIERPKRALTAYNIFFQAQRQRILREQKISGKKVGFAGMARTVAALWKAIDPSEKVYYEEMAAQDRARHAHELSVWKKAKKASASDPPATKKPKSQKKKSGRPTTASQPTSASLAPTEPQLHTTTLAPQQHLGQQDPRVVASLGMMLSQEDNLNSALCSQSYEGACSSPQVDAAFGSAISASHFSTVPNQESALLASPLAFGPALVSNEAIQMPAPDASAYPLAESKGSDPASLAEFSESFWGLADDYEPQISAEERILMAMEPEHKQVDSSFNSLADRMGSECTDLFLNMFS